ncbi:MAG: alcohol dehydrogenase catalytic domain-containing protein [Armatimonadetes bacterium]|nr:alcohol dehydrogenase catalytic domain-containing protein [Armatimonadota bacterium]
MRVRAVSICPSDWRLYVDGHAGGAALSGPIIQGHEFCGDVAAHGPGVDAPPIGARVAVEPSWHCGRCDVCARGLTHLCRNIVFPSFPPRDGALAEYIACPASSLHPLPDRVSDAVGAMVEPLGVAIHAVRLSRLEAGERVLVLGAGVIGLSVVCLARIRGPGCRAAVEPVAGRRRWAVAMGATATAASCRELADAGFEAEVVFDCSGEDGALAEALPLAQPGGRVVVVGIPRSERFDLSAAQVRRRELTLIFTRRSRDTLAEAVALAADGDVDLARLPVRRFSLAQVADAMEVTAARPGDVLRAVVMP